MAKPERGGKEKTSLIWASFVLARGGGPPDWSPVPLPPGVSSILFGRGQKNQIFSVGKENTR